VTTQDDKLGLLPIQLSSLSYSQGYLLISCAVKQSPKWQLRLTA